MFKSRTIGFKAKDYIKLFQGGIDRGMRNICFETTGQDLHHIRKMYEVFKVFKEMNPDIILNVYYDSYSTDVRKMFGEENLLK
jgi:hypothetical protein